MTSGISTTIISAGMLATVPTLNRRVGALMEWWSAATETLVTSRLMVRTRTTANAHAAGIVWPNDHNNVSNAKAWMNVA